MPRYILVSDFQRFRLFDLETAHEWAFSLAELHKHIKRFGFIAGYRVQEVREQDPVNIEAAERMGTRKKFPTSTLADLYDPLTMPLDLVKAHQKLNRAVDGAYGQKDFKSDADRVAFLIDLYQQYTTLLPAISKATRQRKLGSRKATGLELL